MSIGVIGIVTFMAACIGVCAADAYRSHKRSCRFRIYKQFTISAQELPPLERLEALKAEAAYHRRMIVQCAAECCTVMGIDPTEDTRERDMCNTIAFHENTRPADVIARLGGPPAVTD